MTNCVYIFGNGFDIRMGMPTGYPDFLKYYRKLDTAEKVVSSKKEFLSKNLPWDYLQKDVQT